MLNQQIVTITFFRFKGRKAKWEAFRSMGLSVDVLREVNGLSFGKMLGSGGGNGFSIFPDFSVYGLLAVWEKREEVEHFLDTNIFFKKLSSYAEECWTTFMKTAVVHGKWENSLPFQENITFNKNQLVGVLTRATIYTKHLLNFWRFVPSVSRSMDGHKEGLIFSKGIGELPLVQQATFSFWENSELMKAYAYANPHHREVIQKTRELGWYKEELFARFHPIESRGTWNGVNPLANNIEIRQNNTNGTQL